MRELSELKVCLTKELGEGFRHGVIVNMPRSPMAVIYQNEDAKAAKDSVDAVLQSIWGDNRKAIVQAAVSGEEFCDAQSGAPLSIEEFQERVDEMYAADNSFRDMSRLRVFLILGTSSCKDLESFQSLYEQVQQIQEILTDAVLTTSIILLDESIKNKNTANAIRQYLRDLLVSGTSFYSSTVILSNRLSSGSLLAGKRIQENYSMAGWIILLMNSVGSGYIPDDAVLYPIGRKTYLTAAFSEITRPDAEICDIVLHAVLSWLERQLRSHNAAGNARMDIEDLYHRLSLSGGKIQVLEEFYQQQILDRLPTPDVCRFLPCVRPSPEDPSAKPFLTFDQEHMGGCSAMLQHLSLFDQQTENDLVRWLQASIRKNLSALEREKILTAANVQKLIQQLSPEEPSERLPLAEYLRAKPYALFIDWALPLFKDVMLREQRLAAEYTKEFEEILKEFRQGYFPENRDLESYYSKLTTEILEGAGRLGERLLDSITTNSKDREALLDGIRQAVEEIFSARAVFHTPLEQEMVSRMGQNPHDIHNQIYNMLFKDLDGRIRLKTAIAMTPQEQITIINQRDEDGAETDLYRSIQENVNDAAAMTYFDSCNSNSIKIMRFYSCDSSSLI